MYDVGLRACSAQAVIVASVLNAENRKNDEKRRKTKKNEENQKKQRKSKKNEEKQRKMKKNKEKQRKTRKKEKTKKNEEKRRKAKLSLLHFHFHTLTFAVTFRPVREPDKVKQRYVSHNPIYNT